MTDYRLKNKTKFLRIRKIYYSVKFGFISAKGKFRISLKLLDSHWPKEAALKNFGISKREHIEIYIDEEETIKAIEKFLQDNFY